MFIILPAPSGARGCAFLLMPVFFVALFIGLAATVGTFTYRQ